MASCLEFGVNQQISAIDGKEQVMKICKTSAVAAGLFLSCIASRGNAQGPQIKCGQSGTTISCRIDQPTVTQRRTEYSAITFQPNDKIFVQAGGCVQTGGSGDTWKRFVNPQGKNSDRLYHGLISIPGRTEERIQGVVGRWIQLPPHHPAQHESSCDRI